MKALVVGFLLGVCSLGVRAESDEHNEIMAELGQCLVANAPEDWRVVSILVLKNGVNAEGKNDFYIEHSLRRYSQRGVSELTPCKDLVPVSLVFALDRFLPAEERNWIKAEISFFRREGGAVADVQYERP